MLRFRDPNKFSTGNLSNCLPCWELALQDYPKKSEIYSFLSEGVNVKQFFVPFHGTFQGRHFCSSEPPSMAFPNSPSCERFKDFISRTILERVSNGSLLVSGEVGKVHPPHLVMPITVEPSKPRMCHDERFLNCWIKDCPFTLDYITDLPRYVLPGHFQTSFDDKSGYDHVRLHPSSSTFFGLQWKGWYFVFTTIPFGWKASAFVYHSIGMAATNYIRSLGVPCSQYIDDRHCGQLCLSFTQSSYSGFALAEMAAFIACTILISLGYFIGLKKCVLQPSTALRFLGYICDSLKQAFILPQDKRAKFASLRESILAHKTVSLKNLQKFAGKTTSFALVAPAAKLFSNEAYRAISRCSKASTSQFRITKDLRKELLHWRFLDSWEGFLPWRDERHFQLTLFSDASFSGWGACLKLPGEAPVEARGYWDETSRGYHIAAKETRALFNAVQCLLAKSFNARVDVFVDNKVLLDSWEKQISKSPIISDTLKDLFLFTMAHNLSLSLHYVPSHLNPADQPSRVLSDLDCTLSQDMWKRIDTTFGPHTIDLMALPSNVHHNRSGNPLPFFSPFPCPQSAGTNVFAQSIARQENAYVFPPFLLIGPLFRFLESQSCTFTIIVHDISPRKYWWPLVFRRASCAYKLASKGNNNVLLFPTKLGSSPWAPRPLQWDLWAFRIHGS